MSEREAITGLTALGMDPASAAGIHRLSGGASGAGVFGLDLDGRPVVLKISTNPRTTEPGRELQFYRELASQLPIRTPALLSSATSAGYDILLLARAAPAPPAREWPRETWIEIAVQLGRLHRTFDSEQLHERTWLEPDLHHATTDQRRQLWQDSRCADIATTLIDDLDLLTGAASAPPLCLIHGDWHAENLLLDDAGNLTWADWQQVTHRHGPEDLALLWQRAQFDGATPPREEMLAVYTDARGIQLDETFLRAVTAAELLLLLTGWPQFLLQQPSPGQTALLDQLRTLNATWQHSI